METQSAFVRADGAVELNTVTKVRLDFSLVINPSDTESEDTVRLDHTLHDLRLFKLGVLVIHLFNRFENLLNGLQILCLARMLRSKLLHDRLYFHYSVFYGFVLATAKLHKKNDIHNSVCHFYLFFSQINIKSGTFFGSFK